MRTFAFLCVLFALNNRVQAAESCETIHGRARLYCGDGQLRIWQIGTHHEYTPDESSGLRVRGWLEAGAKPHEGLACQVNVDLFADFLVCPTEPFKKGSVQKANVKAADHRHYVLWDYQPQQ